MSGMGSHQSALMGKDEWLTKALPFVGPGRVSSIARRLRYLVSLIYWSVYHRSLSRGRWVAAYESQPWN